MKCLPHNKLPLALGNVLHDWHAEVLAIRAFNRFLLDQCLVISTPPYPTSEWVCQRPENEHGELGQQPFTIRENVQIHMYCSEAPCGDASMELTMNAQEDATPWTSPPPTVSSISSDGTNVEAEPAALRGRSNFSHLGAVRCKPSRPDAPPTLSKSCTDKLALKQATSLLSSTTSLLISPGNAYIHTLILPESQYVPAACNRAFSRSGRLKHVSDETWKGGYVWKAFDIKPTSREFTWSRRNIGPGEKAVPSNLSAVYTPAWQETLIGGVLQGRKQFDPRGASAICRRSMWKIATQIAGLVGVPLLAKVLGKRTYGDMKTDEVFSHRKRIKQDIRKDALKGWIKNTGDDGFEL
ncbi:tRNA-specific adenosine deaminase, partial [Ampelomyces quisqualis]